ncbi:transcription initiation factor TFIIH subunit 3 [Geosmithia morbida]|uniref:General transcription and DNA repair factor IIH subunit TFB4 n=1 Tax=Geosmithia morbida TaxID=1094350 RepID=A0A9P4Z0F9_9HYPO|nr:transcription initiation factor TFIIH subunit 3 [Geosmithia morbida]KAF4125877.1 transcription initiation factor TFIIH subunit 3 [Geosmithia morbida]
MDAVDQSEHYQETTADETPSLLSIILDTNPRAWAALGDTLPMSRAIANILVFVNAHLAFSNANQVAIVASHVNRAAWLYPRPLPADSSSSASSSKPDVDMMVDDSSGTAAATPSSANKFPQFARIEAAVLSSVRQLVGSTTKQDLESTTTQLSGALTLALCHTNKASQALGASTAGSGGTDAASKAVSAAANQPPPPLKGRIVVISVSDSEPAQYIPTMNAVFAAAHAQVAIDALSLSGDPTFLQQACYNTGGTFLSAPNPQGILTYLMFGLVADTEARRSLIPPTHNSVDFRAACFCHGRVVDTGFVCSICLSIFCELPEDATCPTCGTKLALGTYGAKPAVVPRKKKKKKKIVNGSVREDTSSLTSTPRPA